MQSEFVRNEPSLDVLLLDDDDGDDNRLHVPERERLPSPKLSEIAAVDEEYKRPVGFAGQNTQKFLSENDELLQGMGMGVSASESAYMHLDEPSSVKEPPVPDELRSQALLKAKEQEENRLMAENGFDKVMLEVNRNSMRNERIQSMQTISNKKSMRLEEDPIATVAVQDLDSSKLVDRQLSTATSLKKMAT